jgi:hypothetical protein
MHSYKIGFVLRKQWRARLVPAIFFRLATLKLSFICRRQWRLVRGRKEVSPQKKTAQKILLNM